jgi:hypothetical protein
MMKTRKYKHLTMAIEEHKTELVEIESTKFQRRQVPAGYLSQIANFLCDRQPRTACNLECASYECTEKNRILNNLITTVFSHMLPQQDQEEKSRDCDK